MVERFEEVCGEYSALKWFNKEITWKVGEFIMRFKVGFLLYILTFVSLFLFHYIAIIILKEGKLLSIYSTV